MPKVNRQPLKTARIGDTILFSRKEREHTGIVYKVNENSVLVELLAGAQFYLGYENKNTVVSHKNYTIVVKPKVVNE